MEALAALAEMYAQRRYAKTQPQELWQCPTIPERHPRMRAQSSKPHRSAGMLQHNLGSSASMLSHPRMRAPKLNEAQRCTNVSQAALSTRVSTSAKKRHNSAKKATKKARNPRALSCSPAMPVDAFRAQLVRAYGQEPKRRGLKTLLAHPRIN